MSKEDNELTLPSSMTPSLSKEITSEQMGHVVNYKMAMVEQELEQKEEALRKERSEANEERSELDDKFKAIFERELEDKIQSMEIIAKKVDSKAYWEIGESLVDQTHFIMHPYHEDERFLTLDDEKGITGFLRRKDLNFVNSRYNNDVIKLSARTKDGDESILITKSFQLEGKGVDKLLERQKELNKKINDLESDIYKIHKLMENTSKMERQLKAEISKQTIKATPNGEQVIADLEKFKLPAVEKVLSNLKS